MWLRLYIGAVATFESDLEKVPYNVLSPKKHMNIVNKVSCQLYFKTQDHKKTLIHYCFYVIVYLSNRGENHSTTCFTSTLPTCLARYRG